MGRETALVSAARRLAQAAAGLSFGAPVAYVYNPLDYAWDAHAAYLGRYGAAPKRVLFLGMNPGPWGMAQTGVPFGEVGAARDWLGLDTPVGKPREEHPKRRVQGLACPRSEVSGRRLWGLFASRFGTPEAFFADHFVANYCPLMFMEDSGRNRTPDKLSVPERNALFAVCGTHLRAVVETLRPEWIVGIGKFAEDRARQVLDGHRIRIGRILHPSPANPAANRDWAAAAVQGLVDLGVWED